VRVPESIDEKKWNVSQDNNLTFAASHAGVCSTWLVLLIF